jgi:hypothetical protein
MQVHMRPRPPSALLKLLGICGKMSQGEEIGLLTRKVEFLSRDLAEREHPWNE